ncbi:hypothetical protein LSTR_LSTR013892 [Laodelphax striatellus]|uniref:Uncharacterized protein n=1 Tax=Laodelphax striatellus TaxID=195883 RepID=A0A482X4I0_LAOST|nr:hypothetical protein LSTR_LSTR013892 [Laodelphax striatellus]
MSDSDSHAAASDAVASLRDGVRRFPGCLKIAHAVESVAGAREDHREADIVRRGGYWMVGGERSGVLCESER